MYIYGRIYLHIHTPKIPVLRTKVRGKGRVSQRKANFFPFFFSPSQQVAAVQ
uniref:Uncharacterized protein n=1 Tax=Rhizophora mucronata TaxID=61149 RepID=A0A2P2JLA8_RHIMU